MLTIDTYLKQRVYPGRGIFFGLSEDGKTAIAAYFIMGRSENSRNRIFTPTTDGICTQPFDKSKVEDPSLIIYSPVRQYKETLIVTNGDQTDTVYTHLRKGQSFQEALQTRTYEPDAPHYTPRISGMMACGEQGVYYTLSILRKSPDTADCLREFFPYVNPTPGNGHLIHTYMEAGSAGVPGVLPSFAGNPIALSLPACDIDTCLDLLWDSLHAENRVSLFLRYISPANGHADTRIQNAHA